jgi:hypothetical protein
VKWTLLRVYWLPRYLRCTWWFVAGRLFVFRNEPNEFLRFVLYVERLGPCEAQDVRRFFESANEEIALRQRRVEWS